MNLAKVHESRVSKVSLDLASVVADIVDHFHHSYGMIWLSWVAVRGWLPQIKELTFKCLFFWSLSTML